MHSSPNLQGLRGVQGRYGHIAVYHHWLGNCRQFSNPGKVFTPQSTPTLEDQKNDPFTRSHALVAYWGRRCCIFLFTCNCLRLSSSSLWISSYLNHSITSFSVLNFPVSCLQNQWAELRGYRLKNGPFPQKAIRAIILTQLYKHKNLHKPTKTSSQVPCGLI